MVFGTGINDADYPVHRFSYKIDSNGNSVVDGRLWTCPYYSRWYDMLRRCYSKQSPIKTPSYQGTIVCNDWLTFSNFKEWVGDMDFSNLDLDKDLLGDGKVYSPETCCWIPLELNQFFKERSRFTNVAVGVSPKNDKFQARVMNPFTGRREYLGVFSTPEAAHAAWKGRKCYLANLWADELQALGFEMKIIDALRVRYN